jgi:thiamine pyrophosphokinase
MAVCVDFGSTFTKAALVDPTMWQGDWRSTKRFNRQDHTDINEANCILQYNANLPGTNLGSETAEERGQSDVEGVSDDK